MQIIAAIANYMLRCLYTLLVLAGIVYFLFGTATGAEIILRSAVFFIPAKISLGPIQGALYDSVDCQNISYSHQQNTIQIDHLSLRWSPLHLFNRKIVINQLKAQGVASNSFGNIHFVLQGTGQWGHENQQLNIQLTELAGDVNHYPVHGSAKIDYQNGRLLVDPFQLNMGEAFLHIAGSVTDQWDLHWQLHGEQLQKLIPGLNVSSINSTGQVTGPANAPAFNSHFAFLSPLQNSKGELKGNIHLGKNGKSIDDIDFQVINGEVSIASLNIALKDVALRSQYIPSHPMNFSGNFLSGTGRGQVSGSIDLSTAQYPVSVKLDAENIQVLQLAEFKITASPHISIDYIDHIINVTGTIEVPQASIKPKDFANITTLPNEVEFVNQSKKESAWVPNIEMDVQFILGNDIYLAYENLRTTLRGKVTISQRLGNVPTATGELYAIKGKYRAYGKEFNIDTGRLIYAGNMLTNPGLDIRATETITKVDTATLKSQFDANSTEVKPVYLGSNSLVVGIAVNGTLKNPSVSVFSNSSELNQKDILSYLLFGYPASNIKEADKISLLTAALNQGSGGVNKITKKIKNVLGLSELSIGSKEYFDTKNNSTTNNTSLTIGKQIGKRLSLQYSIGLFNPISIFSLRFQINKRLSIQSETIQSETSTIDTGADLIYEFERD